MQRFEIKSIAGAVLFAAEAETFRDALVQAVKADADLTRADLTRANLTDADLARANLTGANLAGANLTDADLTRADLTYANLTDADLTRADLTYANLAGAYLTHADLTYADLTYANLARANLAGAYLTRANLTDADLAGANLADADLADAIGVPANVYQTIVDDLRAVLDTVPNEVPALLAKLWAGEVDGTVYEGACACLVGSVANIRGCDYRKIPGLEPDSERPAERWFLAIRKGDTPVSNPSAAFAAAVIAKWQHERAGTPPKRRKKAAA